MRYFTVVPTLLLGVSITSTLAAPSNLFSKRQKDIPNPVEPGCPLYDDKEKNVCKHTKTPEMWKDIGVGEWLQVMTIGAHPFKKGLYETVRDRNVKLHDTKCGDTISTDGLVPFGDCDDLTDEETCLCHPYAFMATSAMHNFVNYMEKLRLTIATAGSTVSYQVMSMPGLYNPHGSANGNDDIELVGGIMGILGTLAGAVPPLSDLGIGFGLVSGILGMVGSAKEQPDPLAPIAQISSNLGHQVEAMIGAVATYTKHLLYDIPPDTKGAQKGQDTAYTDNPKEMVAVLGTQGAWVDEPTIDGTMIKRSLAAPAINALWNRERIVVIKVSNKDNQLGQNPCEGENVFGSKWKYCDKDGNMYVVRQWIAAGLDDWDDTTGTDVPGWLNATEEYKLTTETIALSSEANQNGAQKYQAPPPAPADLASHFLQKDFGHLKDSDMVFFNLPVCNIDTTPIVYDIGYKKCKSPVCKFHQLMLCHCAGTYINRWNNLQSYYNNLSLNKEKFPYAVDEKVCKEGKKSGDFWE